MNLSNRTHPTDSPNMRRGFFIALTFALLTLSNGLAAASNRPKCMSIQGYTLDTKGQTIPYVSLVFKNSGEWILSDENGHFSYQVVALKKDSILVQRIGYQRLVLSSEELINKPSIQLTSELINLNSIEIEARPADQISMQNMGDFSKSKGMGTVDHSRMLKRIPGLSIKSYGGPAGISTLSLDGGPSSHTRVTVNGIDITSAQNGEADLSQLPLPYIQHMEYVPYDISGSGSGGIDGMVQLESGDLPSQINLSSGSFGHQAYDIYLNHNYGGLWGSVHIGQRHEEGNYPVSWNEDSYTRTNNSLDQDFVAFKLRKLFTSTLYWQASFLQSDQSRGVAGLVWSPDTLSNRWDQLQLLGSTLGWLRPTSNTHLHLALRRSREKYENPLLRINSDHFVQSKQIKLQNEWNWNKHITLNSEMSLHEDEIQSSDANTHMRNTLIAVVTPSLRVLDFITLVPSIKLHTSPDLYERILQDYQAQLDLNLGPLEQIAASHGEVYKYPSFNDLFWEPGGNIGLEAEETDVTTIQADFDLNNAGQLLIQWQKKESNNLIQWMPVHSYWQPNNVQSATRESRKAIWQVEFPSLSLKSHAHLSLIYTRDHTRDTRLRYAPSRTTNAGITWSPHVYEFNLTYNYISDRISMYSYPENITIDASELWSVSAARSWLTHHGNLTTVISVENLTDLEHETIRGYPEPGRSFRLSLNYSR